MSSRIQWTSQLATNIPLIDEQHMELFLRVNRYVDACQRGEDGELGSAFLVYLQRYVEVHFAAEAELMALHHYPKQHRHLHQHQLFCTEINQLAATLQQPEGSHLQQKSLLAKLNRRLVDWLYEHVCMEDRALADYLLTSYQQQRTAGNITAQVVHL